MPERTQGSGNQSGVDRAIAELVKMNPRRVTVGLTLPTGGSGSRPTITLEWVREDTNMPLSALLKQIDTYMSEFGSG
jgi:hypothetical protein